jgi:O-acetyl-ADP-ribose deacetylase (regulator of RNase III)
MKLVKGDLLALAMHSHFDVIVQGCNCFCQMGKGLALSIKEQFPEAYAADCETVKADRSKLGTYSMAKIERPGVSFVIINGYTQFSWKGEGVLADYDAVRSVMAAVAREFKGARIGYPMIGAGLARGDWNVINAIINTELSGLDHTYVEYNGQTAA